MNYFNKFPTISYDGKLAKNLLTRVKVSDSTKNSRQLYLPYTLSEYDRADVISKQYYDEAGYSWLVWYSNDMVDPYYDMPLSDDELYNLIVEKYGSLELANRKIYYYNTNWYNDDARITPSAYDSLPGSSKKYWNPVVNNFEEEPIAYIRKKEDQILSTNKILSLTITTSNTFTVGEEIRIDVNNYAFVTKSNTTNITCQHVVGVITANSTYTPTITGQESGTTAVITSVDRGPQNSQNEYLWETLAARDVLYWEPITFFQYEFDLNQKKREIFLIDNRYRNQIEDEISKAMRL